MTELMVQTLPLEMLLKQRRAIDAEIDRMLDRIADVPQSQPLRSSAKPTPNRSCNADRPGNARYMILGEVRYFYFAIDAFVDALTTLSYLEPNLPGRLAERVKGKKRNHIARAPDEVYPFRSDLASTAREFHPGWYVGTNISDREKTRILMVACDVAGIAFGEELVFRY